MPAAFSVAAGVINPVTGRWMTKSWLFDQLLPEAERTYRTIETQLGIHIYHPIPEVRFCQNTDDVKRAGRRRRNPRYQNVLGDFHEPGQAAPEFNDPHGSFDIQKAAYVDLPQLVHALRASFTADDLYRDAVFEHAQLKHDAESSLWCYDAIRADRVIFCEGAAHADNPWFRHIPLQPAKGETLRCHSPTLQLPEKLYHHTKWLLSYPDGTFRIGASYDEDDLSPYPTDAKKNTLLEAARTALKASHGIEVQEHLAGVRPSSRDSRPILGAHPDHPSLYLLNGLGSKGASTGPLMAQYLVAHMLDARPIDAEVDLTRFLT
jgi:glycine/D-amino acid oxidase-like deaminating enzyme